MRLNFWSKKRAVESEYNWNPNPDPKYRMSANAGDAIFYGCVGVCYGAAGSIGYILNGDVAVAIIGCISAILYWWIAVSHLVRLDKAYQRDSERIIAATKRADGMAYELSNRFPDWSLEDIKHFVRSRIYP